MKHTDQDEVHSVDLPAILEHASSSIAVTCSDGMFVFMNSSHEQMFEYEAGELIGESWQILYDEETVEHIKKTVFPIVAEKGAWRGELAGRSKSGRPVFQEVFLDAISTGGLLCSTRDITDRVKIEQRVRRDEDRLRRSEALSVYRSTVATLAHDLSNVLSASVGYSQLLQKKHDVDPDLSGYLDAILRSNQNALSIIEEMSSDLRDESPSLTEDAVQAIRSGVTISKGLIKTDCHIELMLPEQTVFTSLPALSLTRAVINLIQNSDVAMEHGGFINVELKPATDYELLDWPKHTIGRPDYENGWILQVEDGGYGIYDHDLSHVFRQGYTTKPDTERHGLGLSSLTQLLELGAIALEVASSAGEGTRMTIWFKEGSDPENDIEKATSILESVEYSDLLPPVTANIAVIDDDPLSGALIQSALSRRGLSAEVFSSGRKFFSADLSLIDLLITDFHMPEMNGIVVAARFKSVRPRAPVIAYSGVKKVTKGGLFDAFVPKPIDLDRLIEEVEQALTRYRVEKSENTNC
ncbi:MAG: response regulator [Hyphomonas sp.]|jgi:PAS domain S-box-containing protein|nr:response regulator [Hyphomonas sp.]